MGRLDGRRVLVTGASSGIGAATAARLVAEGARVAIMARRVETLEEIARETGATTVAADVTDDEAVRVAVNRAAEALGGLDGLVNGAGLVRPGRVAEGDPTHWRDMLEVNVLGLLQVTRAVVPHLRAAGRGDVVNVSSMSARRIQSAEMGVYGATKAAVHMLSEGLRRELREDRIRVAVLSPGLVDTPIFEGLDDPISTSLRDRAPDIAMRADEVATTIVDVLAAPAHVMHVEVAVQSIHQG